MHPNSKGSTYSFAVNRCGIVGYAVKGFLGGLVRNSPFVSFPFGVAPFRSVFGVFSVTRCGLLTCVRRIRRTVANRRGGV